MRKSKGFLLLEIMVSVSIMSFGVLLILNSFVRPIRATELSMDYFKAGLLLEEKMSEFYNSGVKDGVTKGEFNGFDSRFFWALDAGYLEGGFSGKSILRFIGAIKIRKKSYLFQLIYDTQSLYSCRTYNRNFNTFRSDCFNMRRFQRRHKGMEQES